MNRALVLSGGSIRGAFQAGAIPEVIASGFKPTHVYGTSVGALNGGFLVNEVGKAELKNEGVHWDIIAKRLSDFWTQKITRPESIGKRRSTLNLLGSVAIKDFKGLMRTRALERLVRRALRREAINRSSVFFSAGVVNLKSGDYLDIVHTDRRIIDYIIASTRIPFIMPISKVNRQLFQDGGIKQIAPFKRAIADGANEIVAVVCQPTQIGISTFAHKNLERYAERIMNIAVNQLINADIARIERINKHCPADGSPITSGPYAGKRRVKCTIIRPDEAINLDLADFNASDIARVQRQGRTAAKQALKRP